MAIQRRSVELLGDDCLWDMRTHRSCEGGRETRLLKLSTDGTVSDGRCWHWLGGYGSISIVAVAGRFVNSEPILAHTVFVIKVTWWAGSIIRAGQRVEIQILGHIRERESQTSRGTDLGNIIPPLVLERLHESRELMDWAKSCTERICRGI